MSQSTFTTAEWDAQVVSRLWGDRLRSFRRKHNLTVDELARLLPVKAALISDWEDGKQQPPGVLKSALYNLEHDLTVKALQNTVTGPPLYRSGPMEAFRQKTSILIRPADGTAAIAQCQRFSSEQPPEETTGNARLLIAAYNAFDSAAGKLGINAVEFAERMADGGLVELVEAQRLASSARADTKRES